MVNRMVHARKLLFAFLSITLGSTPSALAFQANTATGSTPGTARAARYINPLNLPANSTDGSPRGISLGDPTVVRDGDLYYMFASGVTNGPVPQGGAWVSKDFVNWTWKPLAGGSAKLAIAPHVVKFKDTWYMSGNGAPLYASKSVLGPYEEVGPWLDNEGRPIDKTPTANGLPRRAFDVNIFIDKGDHPYVYMAYGQIGGVWGAPLDPAHMNRMTAPPKDLMKFNPDHVWERAGNANERSYFTYIEGPWMFEHNGTYYLEYSASGTEWLTYATGIYMAKSPLGPFTYMPGNPLLRQTHGVNTGPGHGSIIQGPDGNWWQFYLTVLPDPPSGRRVGMDPVAFGNDGRMFVRDGVPSETPQWAPGVVRNPEQNGDSGSIPLTFGKTRGIKVSSESAGREAGYALDNFNGTWWSPAEADSQPSMTLDLLAIPPFKPYTIDSSRIQFHAISIPLARGNAQNAARPEDAAFTGSPAFRYKIEASENGANYTTVVDKTNNDVTRYTEFDDFKPALARYVRLTFTDWPRSPNQPLGVVEFTVFGKYIEPAAH
jgi:xylan 1,4-beta-xylosidase